jgi:lysozyme
LSIAPPDADALAPAVDLETAGNCKKRPSRVAVRREVAAFLDRVEAAWGRRAIVYMRDDWERLYPASDHGRHHWVFRFLRRPSERDWVIWQVHGFAHVDGIAGDVDLDLMR